MGKWKASGPDGLRIGFYLENWDTMGTAVIDMIKRIFLGQLSIEKFTWMEIILIPKIKHPKTPIDFKCIGLCNTII